MITGLFAYPLWHDAAWGHLSHNCYVTATPEESKRLISPIFWDLRPSFKKESITENKDINVWIDKYLGVGEWVMDQSVAIAGSSAWFERKR